MDEFVRIFFRGEALQRVFASVCNNSTRDMQYKISKVISSMARTTLCIRLTPVGLAPFRNDTTMVVPYQAMDRTQLDYLDRILQSACVVPHGSGSCSEAGGGPFQVMVIGGEVIVVTVLESVRVWSGSTSDRTPLLHRHTNPAVQRESAARTEASIGLVGNPPGIGSEGGGTRWQLDVLDVLKAFVSCVFRSSCFTEEGTRRGICEIVLQMVMHEVGLTQNTIDTLESFITGMRDLESAGDQARAR